MGPKKTQKSTATTSNVTPPPAERTSAVLTAPLRKSDTTRIQQLCEGLAKASAESRANAEREAIDTVADLWFDAWRRLRKAVRATPPREVLYGRCLHQCLTELPAALHPALDALAAGAADIIGCQLRVENAQLEDEQLNRSLTLEPDAWETYFADSKDPGDAPPTEDQVEDRGEGTPPGARKPTGEVSPGRASTPKQQVSGGGADPRDAAFNNLQGEVQRLRQMVIGIQGASPQVQGQLGSISPIESRGRSYTLDEDQLERLLDRVGGRLQQAQQDNATNITIRQGDDWAHDERACHATVAAITEAVSVIGFMDDPKYKEFPVSYQPLVDAYFNNLLTECPYGESTKVLLQSDNSRTAALNTAHGRAIILAFRLTIQAPLLTLYIVTRNVNKTLLLELQNPKIMKHFAKVFLAAVMSTAAEWETKTKDKEKFGQIPHLIPNYASQAALFVESIWRWKLRETSNGDESKPFDWPPRGRHAATIVNGIPHVERGGRGGRGGGGRGGGDRGGGGRGGGGRGRGRGGGRKNQDDRRGGRDSDRGGKVVPPGSESDAEHDTSESEELPLKKPRKVKTKR